MIDVSHLVFHKCGVCNGRDTDPELLAVHEARHETFSRYIRGELGQRDAFRQMQAGERVFGRRAAPGSCLDCRVFGRLVKGRCPRCYQQVRNKFRRGRANPVT